VSKTSDAFHSELDYLWEAVKTAQDAEVRSETERSNAKSSLEHASSRVMHLENELAKSAERERRLRGETEQLRTTIEEISGSLALAASQTEEVRAAAEKRALFERELQQKNSEAALLGTEIARLRSEAAGLREALNSRDGALAAMKEKVSGLMALPELSRALAEDRRLSGKDNTIYEHLVERLEKEKLEAAASAAALKEAETETDAAREAVAASERETGRLRSALAQGAIDLERLQAALREASDRYAVSAGERTALEERAAALKAALGERDSALERASAEAAALRRELDAAKAETARVREEACAQAARTEEQRGNFSGAVAQVFDLQKRAASLKAGLTAEQEKSAGLSAALAEREADIEKVNGLLREAKNGLAQEKDTAKRATSKVKALEAEIEALKAKIDAAGDYSAKLLRAVQERDLLMGAQKGDLRKVEALEMENEDLKRKNVKFTGLVRREQADFSAKVINALERAAKDMKTFNLRLPAAERKGLEPAMKNLLASVNLLKGWQEYMDPETPELTETDLAGFISGEVGKWERAFKQRKLSISAAIATPRLRARLDAERMKMLFYQLVKNAYERLPSGGSLRVTLKATEDGRQAVLSFEDSGPGFTQETLGKFFAPFNTTDKGKAGIGLAVARRIAEKHGGTLEASNRKDRGALIEVKLPLGATAP
jgi:signal transduction histidine kinase